MTSYVSADLRRLIESRASHLCEYCLIHEIEMTKNLVKSMPQLQGAYDQFLAKLSDMNLPELGWKACEELLRQADG